jgi:uncharacterized protein YecE (DUF72 family)
MILVGTSGFSYKDWVGPYYPEKLPKRDWLAFYAREFKTCELNFTYYRLPSAQTLERMAAKVPADFVFTLKASGELTHERTNNEAAFAQYVAALAPLIEADKFGCVLAQFPYSFHATEDNRHYLCFLREHLGDLPVVVEFRNAKWLTPETFALLRENHLGFCCVDEPRLKGLIPPVAEVTAETAYVRFHGRNAKKWWEHDEAWERYDYLYSREELSEWAPKVQSLDEETDDVYVFFNNHYGAQAVQNAQDFAKLLEGAE